MIVDPVLSGLHARHSWLPFTQMSSADPLLVRGGEGVWLELEDGRRVIDGIGSWWVNTWGHANPRIARAIADQASRLEQVIYANFVHEPGLRLSARLSEKSHHRLPRVFFSDNGSTAVEIALKMAYQFFRNAKEERDVIVCLENAYHGDTFGAMAAGGRTAFHRVFDPLLFDVVHLPAPSCSDAGMQNPDLAATEMEEALEALDRVFAESGGRIACVLLEPLIQGAGGMRMYHPLYLREARRRCDESGALLIADEVFSGSGRTGPFFAFERAGVWPDLAAVSKGLTGGFLPLAATLATETIYAGFLSSEPLHTLYHGHSMTGSPTGCVAALAALDLFDEATGRAAPTSGEASEEGDAALHRKTIEAMERRGRMHLHALAAGPAGHLVTNARALGSVTAFDLSRSVRYGSSFARAFTGAALEEGAFLRSLGGTVYTAPAFNMTADEQATLFGALERALLRVQHLADD